MNKNIKTVADIGKIIKTTRKTLNLRQQEVADLANVSCRFLSDLENGKPTIECAKVLLVTQILGLEISVSSRLSKEHANG